MNALKNSSFWVFSLTAFVWQRSEKKTTETSKFIWPAKLLCVSFVTGAYCKLILNLSSSFTLINEVYE